MKLQLSQGSPEPLGVTPSDNGINVAVHSAHATAIEICLFDETGDRQTHAISLTARTGNIFHGHISHVAVGTRYGLRAYGPDKPSEGHRFNPTKLLVDPYALTLDRPFHLTDAMYGYGTDTDTDSAFSMPKAIVTRRDLFTKHRQIKQISWADTIIYELNIKGFTRQNFDIPEAMRGTFSALTEPVVLAHLTQLGVTTIELMPAAAWIDERHLPPLGLHNYWGYNPVALMAPDPRLAPGGWPEINRAIASLHEAGFEVILDVVLNHSGESDELGPTLSLRGLDNASYYRLLPDAPELYINDMGCGNCLALDHPAVVRLAMDSLRTWVELGGIDGFRFDLATSMGRLATGFDAAAPLLSAIAQDPVLRGVKLIAEPWDIGPGGYQTGNFPAQYGEWNDHFRDDVRRFWRGDNGLRGAVATRLAGSADLFSHKHRSSRSINFITAHDGFTLADLVSYESKHNEANGEQNRDGTDENYSWNSGHEGPTDDEACLARRRRDQKNLLATLLLARGTPMLAMGSEFGLTQTGNNNAYAQNNSTSWVDWSNFDQELLNFTHSLVALRKANLALRDERFLTGDLIVDPGVPDIEWRDAHRALKNADDWHNSHDDTLIAVLAARQEDQTINRVALVLHRSSEVISINLPTTRTGHIWQRVLDTVGGNSDDPWRILPHSVVLFCENIEAQSQAKTSGNDSDTLLLRLANAAGIAPDWWDIAGNQHKIKPDTQRALLQAMELPAGTFADIRASLENIDCLTIRRLLPISYMVYDGENSSLPVAREALARFPRGNLIVRDETGIIIASVVPRWVDYERKTDTQGRETRIYKINLPRLGAGHYTACYEDEADIICHLTVAPRHCYLPKHMLRVFGISLQSYALRGKGIAGMGDFGTLNEFVHAAGLEGAAAVGVQPLHMLFPADRTRVSPYHPSDRRYLDPMHLDLNALQDIPGFIQASHLLTEAGSSATNPTIDYQQVWSAKAKFLNELFAQFDQLARAQNGCDIVAAFQNFINEGGAALQKFAAFQVISELYPDLPWRNWPIELRDASHPQFHNFVAPHARALHQAMFLQFLCERQLADVAATGRHASLNLGLYRDLAIGCAPDGAEAWANQHVLAQGVSIGAPPDPLGPDGQVWHLPPPSPLAWRRTNYASFRSALTANMRHAGALRIDHALGLARLFWIPDGGTAKDGAYVHYSLNELIGQVALASRVANCVVVGEDLGTVPDGLREALTNAKMLSYRVMMLERDNIAFRSLRNYPEQALCCAATHDLPPLAGWWQGTDILERRALGLIDEMAAEQDIIIRKSEKSALVAALAKDGIEVGEMNDEELSEGMLAAIHQWLAQAPSSLLMVQAEDLAGETVSQNLPGTHLERLNWRNRLSLTVEQLFASSRAQRSLAALRSRH